MSNSIRVLNQSRSEFDFSKISINSDYNIVIHCVYDLVNHFDEELGFLHDPALNSNTLVILWHPVEQGVWEQEWISKLNTIVAQAPFRVLYLTGCSHKPNFNIMFDYKFDIRFFPIFDIRSVNMWQSPTPLQTFKHTKFVFLNAKDNSHRRYVLGCLIKNNLLDNNLVSYQCTEGIQDLTDDFTQERGFSKDIKDTIDMCLPYIPLSIDNSDVAGDFPRSKLFLTYVNIVGETQFINVPGSFNNSFVTEKTFNSIANNQIFFIVGQAGSLELVRSLGYKTFSDIIDETYDTILDNGQRLTAVTQEIIKFVSRPMSEIKQDYIKVREIIQHNSDLLFAQDLQTRLQTLINQL